MYRFVVAAFLLMASLGGCSNNAGIAEFKVYTQTIDSLVKASQPIVDRLAVAERRNAVRLIDQGAEVNGATAGAPDTSVDDELIIAPRLRGGTRPLLRPEQLSPARGIDQRGLPGARPLQPHRADLRQRAVAPTPPAPISRTSRAASLPQQKLAGATFPGGTALNVAIEGGSTLAAFGSR